MYTSNEPEILHENGVKKSLNEKNFVELNKLISKIAQ